MSHTCQNGHAIKILVILTGNIIEKNVKNNMRKIYCFQ